MKLDLDCIRCILLEVEKCGFNEALPVSELEKRLPKIYNEDIRYNCLKLYEAGYIDALCIHVDNSVLPCIYEIRDITYPGHQLLAKIRDADQWGDIKKGLATIKDYSFSAITAFADGMTAAAIRTIFFGNSGR